MKRVYLMKNIKTFFNTSFLLLCFIYGSNSMSMQESMEPKARVEHGIVEPVASVETLEVALGNMSIQRVSHVLNTHAGRLEVVCGSMFSGKSCELIRRLDRARYAKRKVLAIKHAFDCSRVSSESICAHNRGAFPAVAASSVPLLRSIIESNMRLSITERANVIGIDEVQFFEPSIVPFLVGLVSTGMHVIVAGLDMDFRGEPFGCIPELLARADETLKLQACCFVCGEPAHFSQRLIDGQPAHKSDPIILVGSEESYEARCRLHYTCPE